MAERKGQEARDMEEKSLALFWGLPDPGVLGQQMLNPTVDH